MVLFSFLCYYQVGVAEVMLVLMRMTVYSKKSGRMTPLRGNVPESLAYCRYSEALLASDPLLGENDSDDEYH